MSKPKIIRMFIRLCFVRQLPVNDELVWDNGTAFPEPCIDRIADTVGKVGIMDYLGGILLGFRNWSVMFCFVVFG